MVGLRYGYMSKNLTKMVNPRDIAGNTEEVEQWETPEIYRWEHRRRRRMVNPRYRWEHRRRRRRNMINSMVGLRYGYMSKNLTKMVNPRDIAGNTEEVEQWETPEIYRWEHRRRRRRMVNPRYRWEHRRRRRRYIVMVNP